MENYFARQELILSGETNHIIKQTKILVVGAGAGGNEVLKNLALMGFGNFTIVDFDPIESSNLSRTSLFSKDDIGKSKAEVAAAALREATLHEAPNIKALDSKIQDVGKQVFLDNDIVICCVDTNNARAYISDWCTRLKKPFFEMGFEKFIIQICFFPHEAGSDSCLREIIGFGDFSGKRHSCSMLKMADTQLRHIPTIQVAAALAGAFIATEVILFLQDKSQLKNKMLQYSAEYHRCSVFEVPQSEKCIIHRDARLNLVESDLTVEATIADLLRYSNSIAGEECLLRLEDDFIISMDCESCSRQISINKFKADVYDKERWCPECSEAGKYEERPIGANWTFVRELSLLNPNIYDYLQNRLSDFSVKARDLIRVDSLGDLSKSFLVKIN